MRTILSRKSSKDRSGVPVVWAEGDSDPSAIVYPSAQGKAGIVDEVLTGIVDEVLSGRSASYATGH